MKILLQIGVIFGIYWLSQGIEMILPFPFPASVISLIVLLLLLSFKVIKQHATGFEEDLGCVVVCEGIGNIFGAVID